MLRTESEHDRFYGSIAGYYPVIFPQNQAQLDCIAGAAEPLEGKTILDVGCGTGELAAGLAEQGALVTGIDLNDALLNQARTNRSHERILYRKANMLHIARLFGRNKFDLVVCLGNTLVHLLNPMQMRDFFSSVRAVLKPGGRLILQMLDYDYIFREKITSLPLIDREEVTFERMYEFLPGSREIAFLTRLTVKSTGEVIENKTDLLGIGREDLVQLMDIAGLQEIELFGDFDKRPYTGDHLPLVVFSRKGV
ncbi:MAG: class I SAM-dependent methyltransferase [Prolixibacteraceae bacterium]|jgi:SAM-dependent methyltransferase|nr:class I SAM-dependent methyltransferase [Prolixibacteraceae bacterium]HOY50171.1 class I SAM-dependent methyltransferase [Prolixibacteraceae bacterium]HPJ77689.1 class I SAM-dependent methyltransferase [Prolixibacteraceae bacterium]HRV89773.1 class I SAM-dependent methyltransferase [Prolixibacteraceae bacterium]